jgi:23S rRNA pseudouridine1911/1915/1917 synthase
MVVHPAPGAETGTLVNALLHHCGDSLSGIGGALRPGIVHRIDKQTSGLVVVAKSEAAHAGLAALFAARDIERRYLGLAWGAPSRADPRLAGLPGVSFEPGGWVRIEAAIARHPTERKRMTVAPQGHPQSRHAVTRLRTIESFGPPEKPFASLIECRLETGRTHQIRVHATYAGHALVGDPVYGRPRALSEKHVTPEVSTALLTFPRQALHAATLGFRHPVTRVSMSFEAPMPSDMRDLVAVLRRNGLNSR